MMFMDYQNLTWTEHCSYADGVERWEDVSKAETTFVVHEEERGRFNNWEDDPNPWRLARARKMIEDGYNPMGPPSQISGLDQIRYFHTNRYSCKSIIRQLARRPPWALRQQEADLLRDLGVLTFHGRLLIGKWPTGPVVNVDGVNVPVHLKNISHLN